MHTYVNTSSTPLAPAHLYVNTMDGMPAQGSQLPNMSRLQINPAQQQFEVAEASGTYVAYNAQPRLLEPLDASSLYGPKRK